MDCVLQSLLTLGDYLSIWIRRSGSNGMEWPFIPHFPIVEWLVLMNLLVTCFTQILWRPTLIAPKCYIAPSTTAADLLNNNHRMYNIVKSYAYFPTLYMSYIHWLYYHIRWQWWKHEELLKDTRPETLPTFLLVFLPFLPGLLSLHFRGYFFNKIIQFYTWWTRSNRL